MISNCGPLEVFAWLPASEGLLIPVNDASLMDLEVPPKLDSDDEEENAIISVNYRESSVLCSRD